MANITDVFPDIDADGVSPRTTIEITFDVEVDPTTITNGTIVLEGPDTHTLIDYGSYAGSGQEQDILESPALKGLLQGSFIISSVDSDASGGGSPIPVSKVIMTPSIPLVQLASYNVYVNTPLIYEKTVDLTSSGFNSGTGSVVFSGGYNGIINDVINIKITTPGARGTAQFVYWLDSQSSLISIPIKTGSKPILLKNGIYVTFDTGIYDTDDTWYTNVYRPVALGSTPYKWSFTVGSEEALDPGDEVSTSVLSSSSSAITTPFDFLKSIPADTNTNLELSTITDIKLFFTRNVDITSITDDSIKIVYGPVNGDSDIAASGVLSYTPTISGKLVTLTLDDTSVLSNNMAIFVGMTTDLQDTDGNNLINDHDFYFTTKYSPLYSSVQIIRAYINAYLAQYTDDVINQIIFDASTMADLLTFITIDQSCNLQYINRIKKEYVKVATILALLEDGATFKGGQSKKLDQFEISFDNTSFNALNIKWNKELQRLITELQNNGCQNLATVTIKGRTAQDNTAIGRLWDTDFATLRPGGNVLVLYNNTARPVKSYLNII